MKEVKKFGPQFSEMLSLLAKRTKDIDDISMAFVGVCSMISMVRKEVVPCLSLDLESETHDGYDDMLAIHIAENMKKNDGNESKGNEDIV